MMSSDSNNFSSSPPHRLPTLSASQALQNISSTPQRPITTGLKSLDAAVQGRDLDASSQNDLPGGIPRGEVTEVYGPPGVGKTAFAKHFGTLDLASFDFADLGSDIRLQVSASVLHSGGSVVWVGTKISETLPNYYCQQYRRLIVHITDNCYGLVGSRFNQIMTGFSDCHGHESADREPSLDHFHQFASPTLPHLLALLTHRSSSFPPVGTTLLVLDSVSTLFALAFPKTAENADPQQTPVKKSDAVQWASSRRWAVMSDFISKIGRLAATRNIAVLLTSQTTTRIRSETGAVLYPAISSTAWDSGIGTRIALFRDWIAQTGHTPSSRDDPIAGAICAGITKAKGVLYEGVGKVVTFKIQKGGLEEIRLDYADIRRNASPILPATSLKRKREQIADSQSEGEEIASDQEFGWGGGEDTLNPEEMLI